MNWIGHMIFTFSITSLLLISALALGIIPTTMDNMLLVAGFITISTFSALIPDLDQKDSKMSQFIRFTILIMAALGAIFLLTDWLDRLLAFVGLYIIGRVLNWFMRPGHRGFVHSISFGLLLSGAIAGIFWMWKDGAYNNQAIVLFAAIFWGYYMHLVGDGKFFKLI